MEPLLQALLKAQNEYGWAGNSCAPGSISFVVAVLEGRLELKAEAAPLKLTQAGKVDRSRRAAAGRAELLANFFGGAVWGNFRENANCGDPPG